jgi:hypothetical protein
MSGLSSVVGGKGGLDEAPASKGGFSSISVYILIAAILDVAQEPEKKATQAGQLCGFVVER